MHPPLPKHLNHWSHHLNISSLSTWMFLVEQKPHGGSVSSTDCRFAVPRSSPNLTFVLTTSTSTVCLHASAEVTWSWKDTLQIRRSMIHWVTASQHSVRYRNTGRIVEWKGPFFSFILNLFFWTCSSEPATISILLIPSTFPSSRALFFQDHSGGLFDAQSKHNPRWFDRWLF